MTTVIDGVDYGPLHQLIGSWRGEKGLDVSPEQDGEDKELKCEWPERIVE